MDDIAGALAARLPTDEVATDADVLAAYSRDQAGFCDAGRAAVLVMPRSVDSVVATLKLANETGTPVVTRGAGSGLSGGANAIDGCIILSLHRMDRLLELDATGGFARVEPGILNATLDAHAREHGLMYAPDPSSRDISSIGGNVATNAGGACCLKYGVTGDHVMALQAVLADGSVIRTGAATRKNVAGLDLNRLLVGSEGTLAVIVEVTVRLLPAQPQAGTLVAFFPSLVQAGEAIVGLQGRHNLARLEIMDQATVRAVEAMMPMELDTGAAAMIIAEADTSDRESVLAEAERVCQTAGADFVMTTLDEAEGALLMKARYAALPALEKLGHCLLDDVAVPIRAIPDLLEACNRIADQRGVQVATFGHAGDGNLHPTIIYDAHSPDAVRAAEAAFDDIVAAALELGGTITGEHGVGSLKRRFVERMVGRREQELMHGIKAVFDPAGILNPGRGY